MIKGLKSAKSPKKVQKSTQKLSQQNKYKNKIVYVEESGFIIKVIVQNIIKKNKKKLDVCAFF